MKITICTTNSEPRFSHKVVVEEPCDDQNIQMMMEMIKHALLAFGFTAETVREYIEDI